MRTPAAGIAPRGPAGVAALLLACLLGAGGAVAAGETPAGSPEQGLLARLEKAATAREKVDIYCDLALTVSYENAARAVEYGRRAVEIASRERYLAGWVTGLCSQATAQTYAGNHAEASRLCQEAIERATAGGEHLGLAKAYQAAGICSRERADYPGALDSYARALEVVRRHDIRDRKILLTLYGNMAGVYAMLEQWKSAVEYYHKADELIEDDPHYKMVALYNLAYTYSTMKDFASGELYGRRLLALAEERRDPMFVALAHSTLGERYLAEFEASRSRGGLLEKAREHLARSLAYLAKNDRNSTFADTALNMGTTLVEQGKYDEAIPWIEEARAASAKNALKVNEARAHGLLSRAYKGLGRTDLALSHLEKDRELSGKLYRENLDQKVSQMMVRFDTINKEHDLERSRARNESLEKDAVIHGYAIAAVSALSLLLLAVIVLLAVLYRNKRRVAVLLDALSRTDPLTGLLNRRAMTEELRGAAVGAGRSGARFCVLLSDIDHFKLFNDRHGHDCGDAVLRTVSAALRRNCRENDRLCRWGGEEFLVLLTDSGLEAGVLVAEKLRSAVAGERHDWKGEVLAVTMSFGVAEFLPSAGVEPTVKAADDALYAAKEGGRDRVVAGRVAPPPEGAVAPAGASRRRDADSAPGDRMNQPS